MFDDNEIFNKLSLRFAIWLRFVVILADSPLLSNKGLAYNIKSNYKGILWVKSYGC